MRNQRVRTSRSQFQPWAESLESRDLPAGTIAASLIDGPEQSSRFSDVSRFRPKPSLNRTHPQLQTFVYKTADNGLPLRLSVVTPSDNNDPPKGGWPVVFAVHGGGWYRFDRNNIIAGLGQLPDDGYAVVAADYTLASNKSASWPNNLNDLKDALNWVSVNGGSLGLNRSDISLLGQSAGAHLAALLAISANGLKDAQGGPMVDRLMSVSGPMDLPGLIGESDFAAGKAQTMIGASFSADSGAWNAASPQYLLESDPSIHMPPTLLIHGTNDPVVPIDQSINFRSLLQKSSVPVKLVTIPRAGHELLSGGVARKTQKIIMDFLT